MDEEILETAKSICACGAEDEALLKRLCAASAQALERELREGVAPEDCEGAFICASAWLAAAALTDARLGGAEELSSLRAGDVTIEVRGGANSERAAALRRRTSLAPNELDGGAEAADLNREALFSAHAMTDAQRDAMKKYVRTVLDACRHRWSFGHKLVYRWIECLYL